MTTSRSSGRGRRKEGRLPGIWRGPLTSGESEERPAIQHGTRSRRMFGARTVSLLIVVSLSAVLVLFFSSDAFYIHSVAVGGLHYMTKEEVFALTDIANVQVFWIDPEQVRQSVLRSPTVADVKVYIGWPPNMVQLVIEEREPALVWEQAGVANWIDLQGRVMKQREDRPDLLQVSADNSIEGPLSPNERLSPDIVNGALQLHTLMPNVKILRYNPDGGLGFKDPAGWDAWFGEGTDMAEKILIYKALIANLQGRGIQPGEVNVSNADAPYYKALFSS